MQAAALLIQSFTEVFTLLMLYHTEEYVLPILMRFFEHKKNLRILFSTLGALDRLLVSQNINISAFIDTGIFVKVTRLLPHEVLGIQKLALDIFSKTIDAIIKDSQRSFKSLVAFQLFPSMKSDEKNLKSSILSKVFACFEKNSPLQTIRQLFRIFYYLLLGYYTAHNDLYWRKHNEDLILNAIFVLELIIDADNEIHMQMLKENGVVERLICFSSTIFLEKVKLASTKLLTKLDLL